MLLFLSPKKKNFLLITDDLISSALPITYQIQEFNLRTEIRILFGILYNRRVQNIPSALYINPWTIYGH